MANTPKSPEYTQYYNIKKKLGKVSRIAILIIGISLITFSLIFFNLYSYWSIKIEGYEGTPGGLSGLGVCFLPIALILFIPGLFCLIKYYLDSVRFPKVAHKQLKFEFLIFGIIILVIFTPIFYYFISVEFWQIILYGEKLFDYDTIYINFNLCVFTIFTLPLIFGIIAISNYFNKIIRVILPIILIVLIIIIPNYNLYNDNKITKVIEDSDIEYDIEITIKGVGNYFLQVPFVVDENDQPISEIINNLVTENNNISLEINNTQFGTVLKINGSESVHIFSSGTHHYKTSSVNHIINAKNDENYYFKADLSLLINDTRFESEREYMIFCQKDETIRELRLEIHFHLAIEVKGFNQKNERMSHDSGGERHYINRILFHNGWMQLPYRHPRK